MVQQEILSSPLSVFSPKIPEEWQHTLACTSYSLQFGYDTTNMPVEWGALQHCTNVASETDIHSRLDTEISTQWNICGAFSDATRRISFPEQWDACKSCRHHCPGPLCITITTLVQKQSSSKLWFYLCVKLLLSDLQQTFVHISQIFSQSRLTWNAVTYTSNVPQTFSFHHRGKTQTPTHTLALLTAMMPLANRFLLQDLWFSWHFTHSINNSVPM